MMVGVVLGATTVVAGSAGCGTVDGGSRAESAGGGRGGSVGGFVKSSYSMVRVPLICGEASSGVGRKAKHVGFTVSCSGSGARGTNRIYIVELGGERESDTRGIQGVSQRLRNVNGERSGRCAVRKSVAGCVLPKRARGVFRGSLRVAGDTRCQRRIAVYVVPPPRCGDASCNLEFHPEYLFRGLPAGCG